MSRIPVVENDLILSMLPARPGDRRLALGVVLLSLAFFLAAALFAKLPLAQVPAFLAFYQSASLIIDAITALLLFGQARVTGSRALLVLACGYVFTALITLAHLLTFPAVFSPTGLLGAGLQSTAWLYMFWHGGFPLVVVAYAFLKSDRGKNAMVSRNSILAGLLAAALAAAGFTLLATLGHDLLPELILQNRYTAVFIYVVGSMWTLPVIAAAVLWLRRPHSVLDVWLMVVMVAWMFDIGLGAVLNAGRYDLGFYAGRAYGLLASSLVLMVLLFEQMVMYAKLLEARTRERSNVQELGVANADIAARERAEANLRANEWRLRYATESARLTFVEVDLVRGAARTPENFASVMGYTPPPEQEVDMSAGSRLLLQHVVPQDRPLVEASLEEFAAGKAAGKLEYRVLGDDQVERWIETRWSVDVDPDGRPLKSFATNIDVTERMNAQDALREGENRYRALLNAMNEGYSTFEMIYDEHDKPVDYRFLEVNASFEKLTGMHGALGKRISEFAPNLEQHWLDSYSRVARTGEPVRIADEAKGLARWFDVSAFRIGKPGSFKVAVFFNDISERKQAEIALRKSEERYRTLFGSIDEGFCVVEMLFDEHGKPLDFRFLEVNPTFEKQTGLLHAVGKRMRELVPDIEDHWIEIYGKVALTGETARYVNEAKAMDGRWFDVYACRVGGPDSRQLAIVFNDITERRKIAEALADLQRRRDEALTEKLMVATGEIAARKELLRRLAQVEEDERRAIHREMHDRIGQNLASAKLNIDLARANAQDAAATGMRLEAARNLVQDAIDNSRDIMAELRPPGLDEHGLAVALELYAEEVARHLSIAVAVHARGLEERLPRLVETTLFRITQEAISNLAKHANARTVDISLHEDMQEVRLTIADDGTGFDLTRLPETGRYGFKIMRERAEAVDARLEIESSPGGGTRITAIMERRP